MLKWLLSVLALITALVVAVAIFGAAGLIDVESMALSAAKGFGPTAAFAKTYELGKRQSVSLSQARAEIAGERKAVAEERGKLQNERRALEAERQSLQAEKGVNDRERRALEAAQAKAAGAERLSALYASMKPDGAAKVLGTLADTQVAAILRSMSDKQAVLILGFFEPGRAARILSLLGNAGTR